MPDAFRIIQQSACDPHSRLYQEWKSLANSPLEDPDWLMSWWTVFGVDELARRLCLLEVREEERLIGLSPLYLENRRLRLLGSGIVCTDHQELVISRAADRRRTTEVVVNALLGTNLIDHWNVIDLECIDRDNVAHALLQQLDSTGAAQLFRNCDEPTCNVPLGEDWDEYLKTVSKNHRKRCRRLSKRYLESDSVRSFATDLGWETDEAFNTLASLHNKRRQGLNSAGRFENDRFQRFQSLAFRRLASRGQARIRALQLDGQFIAAEYELLNDQTVFSYQSGMDPAAKNHSPGTLSLICAIRGAIGERRQNLDLMRGGEEYKSHWNAQVRPTSRMKIWRHGIPGGLAKASNRLWTGSKGMIRGLVR